MERLRLAIGWSVLVAWLVSMALDTAPIEYNVPAQLHALMTLVATSMFMPTVVKHLKGNNDE